eukprot:m.176699 g.176699  ORF g.176699 m.176699 type:complete len:264 (+) comp16804_c0_seq2:181-972(+)
MGRKHYDKDTPVRGKGRKAKKQQPPTPLQAEKTGDRPDSRRARRREKKKLDLKLQDLQKPRTGMFSKEQLLGKAKSTPKSKPKQAPEPEPELEMEEAADDDFAALDRSLATLHRSSDSDDNDDSDDMPPAAKTGAFGKSRKSGGGVSEDTPDPFAFGTPEKTTKKRSKTQADKDAQKATPQKQVKGEATQAPSLSDEDYRSMREAIRSCFMVKRIAAVPVEELLSYVRDKVTISVSKEGFEMALERMADSNEIMQQTGQVFLV